MMAPVYLSSQPSSSFPLLELKEDHHHQQAHQLVKIFLSPSSPRQDLDSSLPCPTHHFQDPASGSQFMRDQPCHIDKVVVDQNLVPHRGSISSSDHRSSCEEGQGLSAFLPTDQNSDQEINSHHGNSSSKLSLKWMSSKMRIIYKMKNGPDCTTREWSSSSDSMKRSEDCDYREIRYSGGSSNNSMSNGAVRVCSDCKTTTTPLWRSGPRGPKSLCNACGIRQRKARRAMEAAVAATGTGGAASADASSSRANNNNIFKWHNKLDKKPRSNKNHHNPTHQSKRHNVARDSPPPPPTLPHHGAGMNKQYLFGNFRMGLSEDSSSSGFGRVFPENEAEAAALLLMEISRGLLHA